jgi:hypothetical protein
MLNVVILNVEAPVQLNVTLASCQGINDREKKFY